MIKKSQSIRRLSFKLSAHRRGGGNLQNEYKLNIDINLIQFKTIGKGVATFRKKSDFLMIYHNLISNYCLSNCPFDL